MLALSLMLHYFKRLLPFLFLTAPVFAETTHHFKQWNNLTLIGAFSKESKFRYYLEPNFRFNDKNKIFDEGILYAGLGYQLIPRLTVFAGDAELVSKLRNGSYARENRLWQQLLGDVVSEDHVMLINRTRLEERKRYFQSQWNIRLRERMMVRIAIQHWEHHFLVLFDEVFLNLKPTRWTSNRFLEQNRGFIGIGTQISNHMMFDIGYLNQTRFASNIEMNHILFCTLNINLQ